VVERHVCGHRAVHPGHPEHQRVRLWHRPDAEQRGDHWRMKALGQRQDRGFASGQQHATAHGEDRPLCTVEQRGQFVEVSVQGG
jgi:hypothetical protein